MLDPEPHGVTLTPLRRVSARLVDHDWPWAREHADAVSDNWRRRLSERPGLFDGPVLLSRSCVIRDENCEVEFFETSYARFLALHDLATPDPGVANAFAAIVPHTADGAVLLGEMAAHTANGGQIYFPCGTPDRGDVRPDGSVDLAASAARELTEETGLHPPASGSEASWVLVRAGIFAAFLRPLSFAETADALVARFTAFRGLEDVPELARLVVVRCREDIDVDRMPAHARAYLDDVFRA